MERNSEEIKDLIKEEISKNESIGFLKDDNLLFMNVYSNSKISPYKIYTLGLLIPLFIVSLIKPLLISSTFLLIYCISVAAVSIMFSLVETSLACDHFLVYDIKRGCFYTVSYLFGTIPLPFFTSNPIQSDIIKKIILSPQYDRQFLYERIIISTNDEKEIELVGLMEAGKYHDKSMSRCDLFSKCFNVDFNYRGNLEEKTKEIEDIKRKQEMVDGFQPVILVIVIIGLIFAIKHVKDIL